MNTIKLRPSIGCVTLGGRVSRKSIVKFKAIANANCVDKEEHTNSKNNPTRREALASIKNLSLRVVFATSTAQLYLPQEATASWIGEFWRSRQSQNDGAKILAPIRSSRTKILEAKSGLDKEAPTVEDYKLALDLVRPASLNCYVYESDSGETFEEKVSRIQQQFGGAVEVCTFKILLKNVVLYISDEKLIQYATEACTRLINQFSMLDDILDRACQMEDIPAESIRRELEATIDALDAFELALQKCLGLA